MTIRKTTCVPCHVVLTFVILVVLVVVVVVVVVVDFPPSPAGSCPSYYFNASSPKMLRRYYGQFLNFFFVKLRGFSEAKAC